MKSKILINVEKIEEIDDYRKAGITAFLFALTDYTVGYANTYTISEIEKIDVSNKYILINRLLECHDVDNLKKLLKQLKTIKGIVYEDIAVYRIVKELNLDIELIYFQNHFGTNSRSINFWLDRVDSMFLSNELTEEEIKDILTKVNKDVCLNVFGYNQIMYSRRILLTNWSREFNIPYKNDNVLEEVSTKIKIRAIENKYGTVMYSENIFNGLKLLELEHLKYGYFNTTFISHEDVMKILNNEDNTLSFDKGFLKKATIYKLKERSKHNG